MSPTEKQRTQEPPLEDLQVADEHLWEEGPPHETFERLRRECPVHFSPGISQSPGDAGFWSVTKAEDIHAVSLDWETYSSAQNFILIDEGIPMEIAQGMFIGMDPPKHDRVKRLFQRGFTPKAIAAHEDPIREIVGAVLDGLEGRERCDLVSEIAQPAVARVIGGFMGLDPSDDKPWADAVNSIISFGDRDQNPKGLDRLVAEDVPVMFERCMELANARREQPTDDLMSVLVHGDVDGDTLEDHEIFAGFILLMAAGNDSTKATFSSLMKTLIEMPEQRQLLLDDPSLIPDAVEEALRMFPAFSHFRRTATRDCKLGGADISKGEKVAMWYASSNRDEDVYDDPNTFDLRRKAEHQAFGAGGRHFCLGTALARLELRVMAELTLERFPKMESGGESEWVLNPFATQLKTLPVRLLT